MVKLHPLVRGEIMINPIVRQMVNFVVNDLIQEETELMKDIDILSSLVEAETITSMVDTYAMETISIIKMNESFSSRFPYLYCEAFYGETGEMSIRVGPCTGCPYQNENSCKIDTLIRWGQLKHIESDEVEVSSAVKRVKEGNNRNIPSLALLSDTFGTGFRGDGIGRLKDVPEKFSLGNGVIVPKNVDDKYIFFRTKGDGFGKSSFYGWVKKEYWGEFSELYGDEISTKPSRFAFKTNPISIKVEWVGKREVNDAVF